jgi:hypothetical protein
MGSYKAAQLASGGSPETAGQGVSARNQEAASRSQAHSRGMVLLQTMKVTILLPQLSVRNGNLEMAVYFLKAKQRYIVRKMKKRMDLIYIDK